MGTKPKTKPKTRLEVRWIPSVTTEYLRIVVLDEKGHLALGLEGDLDATMNKAVVIAAKAIDGKAGYIARITQQVTLTTICESTILYEKEG